MAQSIKELEAKKDNKDGLTGVPSGFVALDRVTSGWQPSGLIVIAGRPAMGKTSFVLSALRNAAVEFNIPVAIFSTEMSAVQTVNRLISAEAELESEKIKKGNLAAYEWEQLHIKIRRLEAAPIFINADQDITLDQLEHICWGLKIKNGIRLVALDYIQMLSLSPKDKEGVINREQEIGLISRRLKQLARRLHIPIIILSMLNRSVETRGGDKKPQLSDLRDSGSLENEADMVCFLYRPEYYGITEDEEGNSTAGVGEVIIAKHRSGFLDTVGLKFIGRYTKFMDRDEQIFRSFGSSFGIHPDSRLNALSRATHSSENDLPPF